MAISGASVVRIELIDRGDPAAFDFIETALTQDMAWHDLDLSAIVPADASWVLLRILAKHTSTIAGAILFRKNGNANTVAVETADVVKINVDCFTQLLVPCDSSQVIEYMYPANLTDLQIAVLGWV